jgi:hypothetical protein
MPFRSTISTAVMAIGVFLTRKRSSIFIFRSDIRIDLPLHGTGRIWVY